VRGTDAAPGRVGGGYPGGRRYSNRAVCLLLAVAPLAWSGNFIVGRPMRDVITPLEPFTVTIAAGRGVPLPFMLYHAAAVGVSPMDPGTWAGIVDVALFASVVAYICWNRGIPRIGANRGGLFIHLLPSFGAPPGALVPDEALRADHLAGAVLVISGIFLTTAASRRNSEIKTTASPFDC
jgi:drug/metabolite transporter (DMT)-like permease